MSSDDEEPAVLSAEFERLCRAFDSAVSAAGDGVAGGLSDVIEVADRLARYLDAPEDASSLAYVRFVCGVALMDRFDGQDAESTAGEPDDRDAAIAALRDARALLDTEETDDAEKAEVCLWLGLGLAHRLLQQPVGASPEVDEAIGALDAGLAGAEPEDDVALTARFRLGMLLAFRFLTAGGVDADFDRATGMLTPVSDDPGAGPDARDAAHVILAQLSICQDVPVEFRKGPAITDEMVEHVRGGGLGYHSAEAGQTALRHLDAVSGGEALAEPIAMLRLAAQHADGTDPATMGADKVGDLVSLLGMVERESERDSPDSGVFTTMRVAAEARLGELEGTSASTGPAIDDLLGALDRIGDHPLKALTRDLLGAVISTPSGGVVVRGDLTAQITRLERALEELDDHPARIRTVCALTITAIQQAFTTKRIDSVVRIQELLEATHLANADRATEHAIVGMMTGWVEGLRGVFRNDRHLTSSAIARIQDASTGLPEGHELHKLVGPNIAALLAQRYNIDRVLDDLTATEGFSKAGAQSATGDKVGDLAVWQSRLTGVLAKLGRPGPHTRESLDAVSAELAEVLPLIPPEQYEVYDWGRLRPMMDIIRSTHAGPVPGFPTSGPELRHFLDSVDDVLAMDRPDLLGANPEAAMLMLGAGIAARDTKRIDRAIAVLAAELAKPSDLLNERFLLLNSLGFAFRSRHAITLQPRDLDNALLRYEECIQLTLDEPGLSDTAGVYYQLGETYYMRNDRNRRDLTRAATAGLDGLRARMRDVLIQADASDALAMSLQADGEACAVAHWCLEGGDIDAALRALELGRAMVLHAATSEVDAPALLRAGGHDDLADRWAARSASPHTSGDDASAALVPDTLRNDVLRAVEGTETEQRLLSPPSISDITEALETAGAEALVYLVPKYQLSKGFAMVVTAGGGIRTHPLPQLVDGDGGPVKLFEDAQAELQRFADLDDSSGKVALNRWRRTFGTVSEWAWSVMEPVLAASRPAGRDVPRIVLAPVGSLGSVPWHAAGRRVRGGLRYACQDAVITYAASARQFVDASRRGRREWPEAPAIGAGALDLLWSRREVKELQYHYPGSDIGHGRAPTADAIRACLPRAGSPGASMLHLSSHAERADPPLDSHFKLTGGVRLSLREILEQAARRPPTAPGSLVVLSACVSDLTGSSHDEALTLATAFLAGGAAGVVGTRWPVNDRATALFMVMFHHYLNSGYPDPAIALRATQTWMLDPRRELPKRITGLLAGEEKRPGLETPDAWAAFTYQGL